MSRTIIFFSALLFLGTSQVSHAGKIEDIQKEAMAKFLAETGFEPEEIEGVDGPYYAKTYRGYKVLMKGKAGNVWGRYAARIAMGELSREAGGVIAHLGGGTEYGGSAAGSVFDRLLARIIGQPLNITIILKHGKTNVPALDIVTSSAIAKPEVKRPKVGKVGFGSGGIYTEEPAFAEAITSNPVLMKRLKKLRTHYIRVDDLAVSFLWAGQETDYSGMIRDHKDYYSMINSIIDSLADIADAICKI